MKDLSILIVLPETHQKAISGLTDSEKEIINNIMVSEKLGDLELVLGHWLNNEDWGTSDQLACDTKYNDDYIWDTWLKYKNSIQQEEKIHVYY